MGLRFRKSIDLGNGARIKINFHDVLPEDPGTVPLGKLGLGARACNCLSLAGADTLGKAAELSKSPRFYEIKGLGSSTRKKITDAIDAYSIIHLESRDLSDVTIDELGLPEAAYNGLKRAGINDLEQLACLVLSGWPSARKTRWIGASGKRDVTNAFMDFDAKRLRPPYTVTARLVSVWNDGTVHRSLCRADLKERRITDAEAVPASYPWPADREYVEIGSFRYSVSRKHGKRADFYLVPQ